LIFFWILDRITENIDGLSLKFKKIIKEENKEVENSAAMKNRIRIFLNIIINYAD